MNYLRHPAVVTLGIAILAMTALPAVHAWLFVGDAWQGVPPTYGDEILYHSQMHEVADGYIGYGNPYVYEYRENPPLVIFAGNWFAALPLMLGMPLFAALMANFVLWSLILAALLYWLFREFDFSPWYAAASSFLVYLLSFDLMYRPTSRQEVYPVFILFFIGLIRVLQAPTRANAAVLGIATGLSFWVFGYLWQTAAITLGLLFLYGWWMHERELVRAALFASGIGLLIGSPVLVFTYWMSLKPYFWESMARLGLVNTHLPMAEVIYSGGWIGIALLFCIALYRYATDLRTAVWVRTTLAFIAISGLGMWIMEGSNLITGKLLETGEHMRRFIVPWLGIVLPLALYVWWRARASLSGYAKHAAFALLAVLLYGTGYFLYSYVYGFAVRSIAPAFWQEQQTFAAPLAWLNEREPEPVVVWANPHGFLVAHIPTLSRHYPLFTEASIFTLMPDAEIRERYLVASYFDPITVEYLKGDIFQFFGRQDLYHIPNTMKRAYKVCRILHRGADTNCVKPQSAVELKGEAFFEAMQEDFVKNIRPRIKTYLEKYHVAYIVKDTEHDNGYRPEALGATKVYDDGRYEIYALPR